MAPASRASSTANRYYSSAYAPKGKSWDFTPESLSRCYMHLVANAETPEGALDKRLGEKPSAPSSFARRYRRIGVSRTPFPVSRNPFIILHS